MLPKKLATTSLTKWALFLGVVYGAAAGCGPSEDDASITAGRPNPLNNTSPQPTATAPSPTAITPPSTKKTLLSRIEVNPPAFNHPAVNPASIQAVKNAILALPEPLRTKLDATEARVIISPNMTDRWTESMKEQPEAEKDPAPTLAEQPGRIYALDMCVYERPKKRGTTELGPARKPEYIQLQVGDMLFQVLDDMMILSKDPELRKEWNEDKKHIPAEIAPKVGNFTKLDDWGPRETCAEMFGSMMGGRNENTDNLYKYFPRVKKWLIKRLGVKNQN